MSPCLTAAAGGVQIRLKVVPGSTRDCIVELLGNALKVQVSAAPEKGKANEAVLGLLAARLGIGVRYLSIVRGHGAPNKTVMIAGMSIEAVAKALGLG